MENTPNLKLPLILPSQAQKHVTHNEALQLLDTVVHLSVIDRDLVTPPVNPAEGGRYIVAPGASGAWAGQVGKIASFVDGGWSFATPQEGWIVWIADEDVLVVWNGSSWAIASSTFAQLADGTVKKIGINTAADDANRLAIKSDAILLSHDDVTPGSGHMRATLNKAATANDAGFVFQTNWSTRALFGTLGDNSFSVKVSPDGSAFNTGMNIRPNDGHVGLAGYTADAANDLGVKGTNVLFDRRVDHMRINVNKGAMANDAAFGFQSGYSARALAGLLGNNNFTVKVSPDGSNYFTGLTINGANGIVSQNNLPRAVAGMNFNQILPLGETNLVSLNTSISNPMNMFDAATSRVTVPVAGLYLVTYTGYISASGGVTSARVYTNGTQVNPCAVVGATINNTLTATAVMSLKANDYLELRAGNSVAQSQAAGVHFSFSVIYLGPLAV